MTLEAKLAAIRDMAKSRIPPDTLGKMHAATNALRGSGILDRVIKVGSALPPFALTGARGNTVTSGDLLSRGGIVLTVFRGHW
jgi:hypothetical protein